MDPSLEGYDQRRFTASLEGGEARCFPVHTRGAGPVILILQELPGIGPETLRLAEYFVEHGFRVVLPHLFGPLGKTAVVTNTLRLFCMRKEFHAFARGRTSPITAWLGSLCQDLRDRYGVPGVGVIGMCLTGNFALSLMADEAVLAAVGSQPSLPMGKAGGLHMSAQEVATIRTRLDSLPPMQAWRFARDPLCTAARFNALDAALNDGERRRIELGVIPGKGHAVLTLDFVDDEGHPTFAAREKVLSYFQRALQA